MSDLNFGHLITTPQRRDAVHVAVAPVVAGEALEPGQHVGFTGDNKVGNSKEPIGIVDPYLKEGVAPGEQFWLFLYPKTVTNLRHEWSHPAFGNKQAQDTEAAIKWLTKFAEDCDMPYSTLVEQARACINDDDEFIGLGIDTPDRCYNEIGTFWTHIETVTGLKVKDKTNSPFSCAC